MDIFTFIIIIVVSILVTITLSATYFLINSFLGTFSIIIGPLVGAFVGVLFGFYINRRHDKELEEKRRSFFKNLIMHEIEESIKILESVELDLYEKVKLIPEDAWNSLVNSGDIALLEEPKAMDLSDIYFRIKRYNKEAQKINDAALERSIYPMNISSDIPGNLKIMLDRDTIPAIRESLKKIESWLKPKN